MANAEEWRSDVPALSLFRITSDLRHKLQTHDKYKNNQRKVLKKILRKSWFLNIKETFGNIEGQTWPFKNLQLLMLSFIQSFNKIRF